MAYEKQNWECGQVITADKLNHMEDGIANAGGDCDCGYVCYHGGDTIFSETVTLEESTQQGVYEAVLQYDKIILDTTIRVSINGGEFNPVGGEEGFYGDEEFTDPPFYLEYHDEEWLFVTTLNDVHTIEVKANGGAKRTIIAGTSCFTKAVTSLMPCFGSVDFSQRTAVTIGANSDAEIVVYPTGGRAISAAAIAGFAIDDRLIWTHAQPHLDINRHIDYITLLMTNRTNTELTINGTSIMMYGQVECGEGQL